MDRVVRELRSQTRTLRNQRCGTRRRTGRGKPRPYRVGRIWIRPEREGELARASMAAETMPVRT